MKFPRIVKIKQHFQGPVIDDIEAEIASQLEQLRLSQQVTPGMKIAITAGSRGIANINQIIRSCVQELKRMGAAPFIVPAMGSHGGATAQGQKEVLHSLGITEEFCGAPIHSSMEVVHIGQTAEGVPVYMDQYAWEADGIILMGRIKVHTDFKSPIGIESGLMKMAAIGLGKHKQALLIHSYGVEGIRDLMPKVAEVMIDKANILCGIGIVENAFEQTAIIEAVPKSRIPQREKELLAQSAALMPKLPVESCDVLFVDEIGKNYSGTGMDTNIIGRIRILGVEEPASPQVQYIIAGDISEESHGNALGIGLADLTTKRLFDQIDRKKMNENVITSTFLHRAMIPIVLDNDREAIAAAFRASWGTEPEQARFIRIPNTLHLEYMYVSEALLPELSTLDFIEVIGEPEEMEFDENGYFLKERLQ